MAVETNSALFDMTGTQSAACAEGTVSIKKIVTVCDAPCLLHLHILRDYNTFIDLTMHGSAYTFNITRWMGGGMSAFMALFHQTARDAARYGALVLKPDGVETYVDASVEQRLAAIKQACEDILSCLNKIASAHKRGVRDYAGWYITRHKEETTYSEFITLQTCQSIALSDFFAPSITWKLVQF